VLLLRRLARREKTTKRAMARTSDAFQTKGENVGVQLARI